MKQGEGESARLFRRNLALVVALEIFWGVGAACLLPSTISALLLEITPAKSVIGLLGLSPLVGLPSAALAAVVTPHLDRHGGRVAAITALYAVLWAVLGLVLLLTASHGATAMLVGIFAIHLALYLVRPLFLAPNFSFLSAAFGRLYGTVYGLEIVVNRLAGVAGGLLAAELLRRGSFPLNFAQTFLVGGALLTAGSGLYIFMRLPADQFAAPVPRPGLRQIGATILADREYHAFLSVAALVAVIAVPELFIAPYALERFQLDSSWAGVFAAVTLGAAMLGGLTGAAGDRAGHRRLLLGMLALHLAALALALLGASLPHLLAALALASIATAGGNIATINLAVDFAPPGRRGGYTAAVQFVTIPLAALSSPLAGHLVDLAGYPILFGLGAFAPLLATLIALRFRDPRRARSREPRKGE